MGLQACWMCGVGDGLEKERERERVRKRKIMDAMEMERMRRKVVVMGLVGFLIDGGLGFILGIY